MSLKTHHLDRKSGPEVARIPDPREMFPEMKERKVAAGVIRLKEVTSDGPETNAVATIQMTVPIRDAMRFQMKGRRAVAMPQTNAEFVVKQKIVGQPEINGMNMQTVGKREEEKIPKERVTASLTQKRRDRGIGGSVQKSRILVKTVQMTSPTREGQR